jgi:DNA-binding NarL/FixJ family response regulator
MTMRQGAILVVEDDSRTRKWMCGAVTGIVEAGCVYEASTLAQAHMLISQHEFVLALLDIRLPDGSGVDLLRTLKARAEPPRCIMATAYDDDENLLAALRAGADGYLLKSEPAERFAAQLTRILDDEPPLSPAVARRVMLFFHRQGANEGAVLLSPRETEVLRHLALGQSNKIIARELGLSVHTVGDYIKAVYRKLEVSNRAGAAYEAVRRGLLDEDPSK